MNGGNFPEEEKKEFKKVETYIKDFNCDVLFGDEVHFHMAVLRSATWVVKGSQPVVRSHAGKNSVLSEVL